MIRAFTVFDQFTHKPIISITSENGNVEFYIFYLRGTGNTIKFVEDEKKRFIRIFDQPVIINNFKQHVKQFKLQRELDYEIYDTANTIPENHRINTVADGQDKLNSIIPALDAIKPDGWRKLLADTSVVYQYLEDAGVRDGYDLRRPQYGFTYTGRAKTTGFSLHSANQDNNIKSISDEYNLYIHLDWVAADMRAASILSNDETMCSTFEKSDPYTYLVDATGKSRDACKIELLRSIYSLNIASDVLEYFPQFRLWMSNMLDNIKRDSPIYTILKRPFIKDDNHDIKSVFNAIIQGTVAHAMQNVICQLYHSFPQCILAEIYDSLVLVCNKSLLKPVLDKAITVMRNPFNGLIDHNPKFPLVVSIGDKWRQWKQFKVIR